ncbi:hypothetical protein JD969_04195 [Planctomycetota bacterium]|nr:hypothetical protein JD969_04195 [Planctomycetota bacterium]
MSSTNPSSTYKLSGKFDPKSLLLLLTASSTISAILGIIYGIALYYMPYQKYAMSLTIAVGIALGLATLYLASFTQIRNRMIVTLSIIPASLITFYFASVSNTFALSDYQTLSILPHDLFNEMKYYVENGAWVIQSKHTDSKTEGKGAYLIFVWSGELITLIITGIIMFRMLFQNVVYCEHCKAWVKKAYEYGPFITSTPPATIKQQIESGDYSFTNDLTLAEEILGDIEKPENNQYIFNIDIKQCDTCSNLHLLKMKSFKRYDPDGQAFFNTKTHIKNNIITADQLDNVLEAFNEFKATPINLIL